MSARHDPAPPTPTPDEWAATLQYAIEHEMELDPLPPYIVALLLQPESDYDRQARAWGNREAGRLQRALSRSLNGGML